MCDQSGCRSQNPVFPALYSMSVETLAASQPVLPTQRVSPPRPSAVIVLNMAYTMAKVHVL